MVLILLFSFLIETPTRFKGIATIIPSIHYNKTFWLLKHRPDLRGLRQFFNVFFELDIFILKHRPDLRGLRHSNLFSKFTTCSIETPTRFKGITLYQNTS